MKNISWGSLHDYQPDPSFGDQNPRPIPTLKGYRYNLNEKTDIRIFRYGYSDTEKWGIQVSVMRDTEASSLEDAKKKARELARLMNTPRKPQ